MRQGLAAALLLAGLAACEDDAVSPTVTDAALDGPVRDVAADAVVDAAVDAPPDAPDPCASEDGGADGLPSKLSCTGLYTDIVAKTVAKDAVPYTPGIAFWSDGAVKDRWLLLPPNGTIDTTDLDELVFPVGTKAWKEFKLAGKRIETRIYWKRAPSSWSWATYVWTADESEAVRNDNGALNVVGSYEIPEKSKCDVCHGGRKDKLLGVEAVALALSTAQGITLDGLAKAGRLSPVPPKTVLTLPEDATGKAAVALGYLHMNCGVSCHNRSINAAAQSSGLFMKLPAADLFAGAVAVTAVDTWTTAANQAIVSATFQSYTNQGYKRLLPKDSSKSLIPTLAGQRGGLQMPTIATHEVDTVGVKTVKDWIDAL